MKRKLTEEDYSMIHYFHIHKGDVTRWTEWEKVKPILKKERPELYNAFEQLKLAQLTLDTLINNL